MHFYPPPHCINFRYRQAFVGLLLFVSVFSAEGYQNNFDQPLNVDCQAKNALSGVKSIYIVGGTGIDVFNSFAKALYVLRFL